MSPSRRPCTGNAVPRCPPSLPPAQGKYLQGVFPAPGAWQQLDAGFPPPPQKKRKNSVSCGGRDGHFTGFRPPLAIWAHQPGTPAWEDTGGKTLPSQLGGGGGGSGGAQHADGCEEFMPGTKKLGGGSSIHLCLPGAHRQTLQRLSFPDSIGLVKGAFAPPFAPPALMRGSLSHSLRSQSNASFTRVLNRHINPVTHMHAKLFFERSKDVSFPPKVFLSRDYSGTLSITTESNVSLSVSLA